MMAAYILMGVWIALVVAAVLWEPGELIDDYSVDNIDE